MLLLLCIVAVLLAQRVVARRSLMVRLRIYRQVFHTKSFADFLEYTVFCPVLQIGVAFCG